MSAWEAGWFAEVPILPNKAVASRFDLENPALSLISLVANDFETSLSATTWRFLDLTAQPCAMVWSHAGKAAWYRTNDALPFLMPRKSLPSPVSVAGRLFAGESFPDGPGMQEVDADAWFYPGLAERIGMLYEDSVYLQNYNAVLTLLWAINVQGDKRESGDGNCSKSWKLTSSHWAASAGRVEPRVRFLFLIVVGAPEKADSAFPA